VRRRALRPWGAPVLTSGYRASNSCDTSQPLVIEFPAAAEFSTSMLSRPFPIVAALRSDETGATRAQVAPITHLPPAPSSVAIEIPASAQSGLKLDAERSWVVLSEWNEFVWPAGPDQRRLPNADDLPVAYGMLPPKLFDSIRERFLALAMTDASPPRVATRGAWVNSAANRRRSGRRRSRTDVSEFLARKNSLLIPIAGNASSIINSGCLS